jgi:hypothetical protein
MPTSYSGLDMTLKQMRPGKAQELISLFKAGDRKGTEAVVARERLPSSIFEWCVVQGMHITGTKTPFDFLTAIAMHSLDGILHNVKQDILLTEGEQDHLFDVGCPSDHARTRLRPVRDDADIHGAPGGGAALPARELGSRAARNRTLACELLLRHAGWREHESNRYRRLTTVEVSTSRALA